MHGIQSWIALPDGMEEIAPAFAHTPAEQLPEVAVGGATLRLILGEAFGAVSPVRTYSKTLYAEARLPAGERLALPLEFTDRAGWAGRHLNHRTSTRRQSWQQQR